MENVNSHILKLKGNSELPEEIEIGHNYHIALEGSVTGFKVEDNEDGTFNKIYDFKPVKVDVLTPLGKSLKLKDPRKSSQKFRNYCYKIWIEEGYTEPFDEVYENTIWEAMSMMPALVREAIKRMNNEK